MPLTHIKIKLVILISVVIRTLKTSVILNKATYKSFY